jgi:hypothetical protein
MAWTGAQHAIVWQDIEVSLARIDCDCPDQDEDGISACKDCDDTSASCTTECIDTDGDTVYVCANDCDDSDPDTYPQATQICDGANNDCDHASWPALTGTNEADGDGDGQTECLGDCLPADGQNWATPGEVQSLRLTYDSGTGVSTLSWQEPVEPGASSVLYDVVRTGDPQNFDLGITCVAGDDTALIATDSVNLQVNTAAYYLIRAENQCPDGLGDAGAATDGTPRMMRDCK